MVMKTYSYDYDEYEAGKGPSTMVGDILADPDFPSLTELVVGNWGSAYEEGCQPIIDGIVESAGQFAHIEKLFIGDMDFEECEVSWIIQGNYGKLWAALPNLRELTIKGSTDLALGEVCHENLEALTIICGGLPTGVIEEIEKARLPKLKKLLLYMGSDNYGFDGNADTIRGFLEKVQLPQLEYLGIADSEIQDELTAVVLESKFMGQIQTLDLSCGTLSDKGGELLLNKLPQYGNIEKLDVHYHFMSDEMVKKLEALSVEVDASEKNKPDNYRGEVYMYAMLTE
ncbi:cytoplasmic protein [Clostridiaceae bacterium]|nr:cytoplasmic protein [Clostridiaceae bacterium]RKI14703.1 cytoplasmic protein [bacterium 1XD21-70]